MYVYKVFIETLKIFHKIFHTSYKILHTSYKGRSLQVSGFYYQGFRLGVDSSVNLSGQNILYVYLYETFEQNYIDIFFKYCKHIIIDQNKIVCKIFDCLLAICNFFHATSFFWHSLLSFFSFSLLSSLGLVWCFLKSCRQFFTSVSDFRPVTSSKRSKLFFVTLSLLM